LLARSTQIPTSLQQMLHIGDLIPC